MKYFLFIIALVLPVMVCSQGYNHHWLDNNAGDSDSQYIASIPVPDEFIRIDYPAGSFGDWIRHLPLKSANAKVYHYDGREKPNRDAYYRVINIETGTKDLQQCADAVIRFRAEYLFEQKQFGEIAFKFTSGDLARYSEWIKGIRPRVDGNRVNWVSSANSDSSYLSFRQYLDTVFMYAGSYSLAKELAAVENPKEVRIGDVLIQGGFPGHAVMVVDVAGDTVSGDVAIMLAQGFTPAQDIHILNNPINSEQNPWYIVDKNKGIITPEWIFGWRDLMRFQ